MGREADFHFGALFESRTVTRMDVWPISGGFPVSPALNIQSEKVVSPAMTHWKEGVKNNVPEAVSYPPFPQLGHGGFARERRTALSPESGSCAAIRRDKVWPSFIRKLIPGPGPWTIMEGGRLIAPTEIVRVWITVGRNGSSKAIRNLKFPRIGPGEKSRTSESASVTAWMELTGNNNRRL